MPPRRSHKKSRAGCRRCKNRKIKCDEVYPRCGNCTKHGVACDFENPEIIEELNSQASVATDSPRATPGFKPAPQPSRHNSTSTTAGNSHASPAHPSATPMPAYLQTPTPALSSTSASGQHDRMLELRLLHQYTTVTYKTLLTNFSPHTENVWQRTVPQMAFSGKSYLADAILSVAALHLRTHYPEDKALIRASHAYAASTLTDYLASLKQGITAENAEALFLTATLIAFQATASRIFIRDDGEPEDTGDSNPRYNLPLPWFHAFQGVKTMVATSWLWIRNSAVVRAVIESQPGFQLNVNTVGSGSFFGHLLEGMDLELAGESTQWAPSTHQSYIHAVCVLNWAHQNTNPSAALTFPATVSRRFIDLVDAKRPRALAIIACFFALLKRMDSVWWLHDVSRREVMGLMGLFEAGSNWWKHLEWPIRIALMEGPIPPEVWGTDNFQPQISSSSTSSSGAAAAGTAATFLFEGQQTEMPPIPILDDLNLELSPASPD